MSDRIDTVVKLKPTWWNKIVFLRLSFLRPDASHHKTIANTAILFTYLNVGNSNVFAVKAEKNLFNDTLHTWIQIYWKNFPSDPI